MKLRSWFLLTSMAGPRMTWWLALVYFGAVPLILVASAIGALLLVPKSISLSILHLLSLRGTFAR